MVKPNNNNINNNIVNNNNISNNKKPVLSQAKPRDAAINLSKQLITLTRVIFEPYAISLVHRVLRF